MKLPYQSAAAELIALAEEDLIVTSGEGYEPPESEEDGDIGLPKVPLG